MYFLRYLCWFYRRFFLDALATSSQHHVIEFDSPLLQVAATWNGLSNTSQIPGHLSTRRLSRVLATSDVKFPLMKFIAQGLKSFEYRNGLAMLPCRPT